MHLDFWNKANKKKYPVFVYFLKIEGKILPLEIVWRSLKTHYSSEFLLHVYVKLVRDILFGNRVSKLLNYETKFFDFDFYRNRRHSIFPIIRNICDVKVFCMAKEHYSAINSHSECSSVQRKT